MIAIQPVQPGKSPDMNSESETKIEEVVEWKTNFEQGIKCRKIPLDAKIRLDFNEITLGDLTKFISCVTEQNFLLTGGVFTQELIDTWIEYKYTNEILPMAQRPHPYEFELYYGC